mgnify:CR=1 FL=1
MAAVEIGLTGGIASGKSLVGGRLAQLGARVIDHDQLARDVVEVGTAGLSQIVDAFGTRVLAADGSLDRRRLGQIVFADELARRQLNDIVHPLVRQAARDLAAAAPADAIVVQMIPLLVETGQQDDFDALIVVDVPQDVQLARLMARNGFSRSEAQARIASQASRAERLAAADFVIDNAGSIDATLAQVDDLWRRLTQLRDRKLG